jgi:hemerythrin
MPPLKWQDKLETGITYIDYEHRRLVDRINRICAISTPAPMAVVDLAARP